MPACPSAPCFSPEATGSVPLLRDLLSDADVTRLHTLRPAPPVPGLYAALCRRVPWPDVSRALPCNALPDLPGTTAQAPFASLPDLPAGSLEGLRLGYVLFSLPWPDAVSLLRACALAARQLWLADFILAERNLGLPAALLRRLLPGFLPWGPATPARIWLRRGGLEGCLRDAGLAAAQRRTLLAGAAALILFRWNKSPTERPTFLSSLAESRTSPPIPAVKEAGHDLRRLHLPEQLCRSSCPAMQAHRPAISGWRS